MGLKTVTRLVVSYTEIPEELTKDHWINEHDDFEYVEVHIEEDGEDDPINDWLIANYPELKDEDSFYIHMDHLV